MRGFGRIKKTVRRGERWFRPAAAVLMYHRIADVSIDPRGIAVSPMHFAQQLEVIHQTCHPMRLLDLVEAIRERHTLPKRSVVITFDDAYVDFARQAYPLLEQCEIPATVFVTTGYVDSSHNFWWLELDRLLLEIDHLPPSLRVRRRDRSYEWPTCGPEERQVARQVFDALLKRVPPDEQLEIVASMRRWANLEDGEIDGLRALSSEELCQLTRGGLVEFGAHSVSHADLSALDREDQRGEILCSRQRLETILGGSVPTFAYPYGLFSPETVELVEAAGFKAAFAAMPGCVKAGADLFRLPRFGVGNWDAERFRRHLEYYFLV